MGAGVVVSQTMTAPASVRAGMIAPISVVIPTFHRREVLAETLDVLRQCRPSAGEILVMVDFGDRETRRSLEPRYPEVRWLEAEKRMGPGGLRNILIAQAAHPFLVSLDDDSCPIDMDFLAVAADLFRAHSNAAVFAAGAIVHDGEPLPPRTNTITSAAEFVGCGAAIRQTAFLDTQGYLPLELGYGAEEVDVSLQLLDKGWTIVKADTLRVRHRTSREHQATPDVTSAHISNIALVGYVRYPFGLWAYAVLQIGRRVLWSFRNGRSAGVLRGLARIPAHLWRHRSQRAPVKARVILETRRLRGGLR
jgi:GT2 family glycosyltransferase